MIQSAPNSWFLVIRFVVKHMLYKMHSIKMTMDMYCSSTSSLFYLVTANKVNGTESLFTDTMVWLLGYIVHAGRCLCLPVDPPHTCLLPVRCVSILFWAQVIMILTWVPLVAALQSNLRDVKKYLKRRLRENLIES